MNNPFKQFLPDEEPSQSEIKADVMGSIHLKSFLANILELITAIFGLTLVESISTSSIRSREEEDEIDGHWF